jgi:hypothetical protein
MEEIRLAWLPSISHHADVVQFSDEWVPASSETLATMAIVLRAANEIYGAGTHWIETRAAVPH